MVDFNLLDKIKTRADEGMPIFGTCAGAILLAKDIEGSDQPRLGMMNIKVRRNAYGRQRESFEAKLSIDALGKQPFRAVFIRAPLILEVGPQVGVMAMNNEQIILCRQGNFLAGTFHPELTDDARIHKYFIKMVKDALPGN